MKKLQSVSLMMFAMALGCGASSKSNSTLKDEFSGNRFYYLDSADRQQVLTDLRDMVVDNYVLVAIKSSLGIVPDAKKLFNDAISAEASLTDPASTDTIAQAVSNLSFLDRVQKTIAAFKDTHFSSSAIVPRSVVLNGLQVERVGSDIRVTGKRNKVIAYDQSIANDPDAYNRIQLGAKVVSIDGIPAETLVAEYRELESASTPASADMWAVQSLSIRDYRLPEKAYADWQFEAGTTFTVRLPYYYRPVGPNARKDEKFFFETIGIKPLADLQLDFDSNMQSWAFSRSLGVTGFSPRATPNGLVGEKVWYGGDTLTAAGRETHRTGYILKDGKAYGVLQVFEFSSSKVTAATTGNIVTNPVDYITPVRDFVTQLKNAQIPLILDLRYNGGGNPMNAIALLSAIAKTGETYPSTTRALRVTRVIRQMLEADDLEHLPNFNSYDYDQTALEQLRKAIAAHSEYTTAFTLTDDVKADPAVGGYDQKIVALISPMCISACDGMGMLLKTSKRAELVGTTTNGTGAGFIGSGSFEDIQWHDRYEVVSLRIPNRLFGLGGALGEHVFADPNSFMSLNSENHPTQADTPYADSLIDHQSAGAGWYAKALSLF